MQASLKGDVKVFPQDVRVGNYMMATIQPGKCAQESGTPYVGANCSVRHNKSSVEIESELFGIGQHIGKEPLSNGFTKQEVPVAIVPANLPESEYTREKRACNTLSGITINRFEPLSNDPQELNNIIMSGIIRGGQDTRNFEKDKPC